MSGFRLRSTIVPTLDFLDMAAAVACVDGRIPGLSLLNYSAGFSAHHLARLSRATARIDPLRSELSNCDSNQIGSVLRSQLLHDMGTVNFEGSCADSQLVATLLV